VQDGYGNGYRHGDEQGMEPSEIPDGVKKFIVYFRNAINEGRIFDIQNIYDTV